MEMIKKILKSNRHTHLFCKGLKCIKNNGIKYTIQKVKVKLNTVSDYDKCIKKITLTDKQRKLQCNTKFEKEIKFSIVVPLYNTPEDFLTEMIESCINQTYSNWELCLADGSDDKHIYVGDIVRKYAKNDKRIIYKVLDKNLGISENTNECINMATGQYIGLFDHDDLLHPSALFEYMKVICKEDADFIYCDELTFEESLQKILVVHYKPDFAIDNLRANNYICHFTVFKKELLNDVGMFRKEYDGSQDHDMILRLTEKAEKIIHIPKLLYFWRSHPQSVSADINSKSYAIDAGKSAVLDHLKRNGMNATIGSSIACPTIYRFKYEITNEPLISIIIPNKDNVKLLSKCLKSILEKSTYKNIEIIVVENNSEDKKTFDYYETLKNYNKIKVIKYKTDGKFNYSAINNYAVKQSNGEHLIFLNNDIEIINEDWIEEMLMYSQRSDVGCVGAKLYYDNNTIQHAGIGIGILEIAGHYFRNFPDDVPGYMGRLHYAQNVSAVTAACLMIKKNIFEDVNGFDEKFEVAFNDIDLCLKVRKLRYLNVWTPYARAYHYESVSRGYEDTPEKQERFTGEINRFKEKWISELEIGDPYYNVNLTLNKEDFSLR